MNQKNRSSYLLILLSLLGIFHVAFPLLQISTAPVNKQATLLFNSLQVALGILLLFLPPFIEKLARIRLPKQLVTLYWLFIYFSVFLGTGLGFYGKLPLWDKFLHTYSAMLSASVGLTLMLTLIPPKKFKKHALIGYLLFAFTFSMTVGVLWEFYEHTFDGLLSLNMQRHTRKGTPLIGREALKDTMGDLYANALGATIYSVGTYFQLRHNKQKRSHLTTRKITRS
ncbi:hypothetical protein M2909_02195 [Vagococcus lutrae]|uniref:hypothetical protein n=1 Tax=Vagococcus lutrae TaxID=81947 RepID=UPI00200C48C2|nr:hypothetical protein [Vagococcus lutrae]UQF23838.1 hypothetical protein M2909_02195 [Vagococcus lutrae]UQF64072.1 hypothetical protein M2908_09515 [Vagococcus lutrae]